MYVVLCTCCSLPTRPHSGHNVVVMQCGGACMLSAPPHPPKSADLGLEKDHQSSLGFNLLLLKMPNQGVCVYVYVCAGRRQ